MKNKKQYFDDEEANLDMVNLQRDFDNQYESMLPKQKPNFKSLSYFQNSQKYAGRVQSEEEKLKAFEDLSNEQEQEQQDPTNGIKQALLQIKNKRREKSRLLTQNLKLIDEEDRENIMRIKEEEEKSGNSAALQNQLFAFNKLIQIRYFNQKNLQQLKKYPTSSYPADQALHQTHKICEKQTLTGLNGLLTTFENLSANYFKMEYNITKCNDAIEECYSEKNLIKQLNVESIWERFEEQTKDIKEKLEQQVINWSQRTTLLRNSVNKSQYNSLLMQTPVGQAKKAVGDWQKVSKKCQLKRSPFRILFQDQDDLKQNSNKNIYDDIDLMQEVQKNYQQQIEKDEKDFLISDTMKYLQSKSKTKSVKDVDRKASKNRKIRYNVHPKLLNFMPCQNENLLEARDEVVKNLFNKGSKNQEIVDYIDI